ncbi:DUF3301 domain-containing protein [Thiohalocapsa sp. ML1]|jgi:hypothetical protein|uniref:DUF3301 domain-containing protein n=1 Tax=Thiohalocapsa sp. ML1 TaxID=1431688 RepID=UPI000731F1E2|nr:DUF3301 domain-containing protein [Thiohalocapsa sp. ML1]
MTVGNLSALLLVLLAGWLWLNTLRAHELALAYARRACERADVQLLDQAVVLRALALRWTADGLKLRRTYGFELSADGVERQPGQLVLLGLRLQSLSLGDAEPEPETGEGRFEP